MNASGLITASAGVTLAANQDLTMSGTGDITGVTNMSASGQVSGGSLSIVGGASNVGALTCSDLLTANFGMSITGSALNMGDQDIINCGTLSCDSIFLTANEDIVLQGTNNITAPGVSTMGTLAGDGMAITYTSAADGTHTRGSSINADDLINLVFDLQDRLDLLTDPEVDP